MEIYGCNFEYAGKSSRAYGLIFATVETSRHQSLSGQTGSIIFYNNRDKKQYYIGTSFDTSALSFDAEVVSKTPIDATYRREIEKWLFGQNGYKKLYMDYLDDYFAESYELVDGERKRLYLNCKFVNPSKVEANGIVGYRFTVECDSHLAWQDPVEKYFELNHLTTLASSLVQVDVDSDIGDYIYPKVTITVGSDGGTIIVANHSDDSSRLTKFVDMAPNETIIMNGATNYVSGNYYGKFAYKNFVRMLDGENQIYITGNVKNIKLEWQNMRYL